MAITTIGRRNHLTLLAGAIICGLGTPTQLHAQAIKSAAICTETFATRPGETKPWLDTVTGAMAGCKSFLNTMNSLGQSQFFFSTNQGEHHALETQSGVWEDLVEDQDFLFWIGHAAAWSTHGALLAGFNVEDEAFSENMLLGNEGRRLSVLALQGCMVLTPGIVAKGANIIINTANGPVDTGVPALEDTVQDVGPRWSRTMASGLRLLVGFWNSFKFNHSDPSVAAAVPSQFAIYMKNGMTITEAWWRAAYDGSDGNNPAVLASGRDSADCHNRLLNMTVQNMNTPTFSPRWKPGWVRCAGFF